MIKINLLSSHEERLKRSKNVVILLLSIIVIIAFAFLYANHMINSSELSVYTKKNTRLSYEISAYSNIPEAHKRLRNEINSTIEQLNNLRRVYFERNKTIMLLNDIAKLTPGAVYLSKIEMEGDAVLVSGQTDDNNAISEYIKNLSQNSNLSKPQLASMTNSNENDISKAEFSIGFNMLNRYKLTVGE